MWPTGSQEQLGLLGAAAGDPGPVLVEGKHRFAIALSGVDEVLIRASAYAQTFRVGRRPLAMASVSDYLYVAGSLDDSLTVFDWRSGRGGPRSL